MWTPPDLGRQYVRELERKQREEAYLREGRTGQRSYLLGRQLGVGQKLTILGVAVVAIVVALILVSALTSPPAS